MIFQQDVALHHFALAVRELLDLKFPNRLVGRSGAVEWPPRSPDLSLIDFFLGGTHSFRRYVQFILETCQEIDADKDLCSRVCMSVRCRLEKYVNADDKYFEYPWK